MLAVLVAAATINLPATADPQPQTGRLTAHEWGTFTTVAGEDGQASQWLPLGGPTDLPCFVDHFQSRLIKVLPSEYGDRVDYETARTTLTGTVRMETPVLYFYSPAKTTVDVRVRFPQGMFTEWYPRAEVDQVPFFTNFLAVEKRVNASIRWKNVTIVPRSHPQLPDSEAPSHYYAARDTDADPVRVGDQDEKFLFYRGVGGFDVPLSAIPADGNVVVRNTSDHPLSGVVLFTNQGGRIGYRVHGTLEGQATIQAPALDGSVGALGRELETMLNAAGLFPREAKAMVDTWRDSWFEEGTRIVYVVPQPLVDQMLPLTIEPQPSQVARVFVGRMDVITPAAMAAVQRAIERNDAATLGRYGRLMGSIGERILARTTDASARARIRSVLDSTFKAYAARVASCS